MNSGLLHKKLSVLKAGGKKVKLRVSGPTFERILELRDFDETELECVHPGTERTVFIQIANTTAIEVSEAA